MIEDNKSSMEAWKEWIIIYNEANRLSDITIKRVGSHFRRYVLIKNNKYYYCGDHGLWGYWGTFKEALWFASWKNASWRRFNLT